MPNSQDISSLTHLQIHFFGEILWFPLIKAGNSLMGKQGERSQADAISIDKI